MAACSGFMVFERSEEWEQGLTLRTGAHLPDAGILDWCKRKPRDPVAVFPDRAAASAAITRTEHYRLAFGTDRLPERKFCEVVPLARVEGVVNG